MAVAEKTITERVSRNPERQRAWFSLVGAAYVLASLWLIFGGVPTVWGGIFAEAYETAREARTAAFLPSALLLIVVACLGTGLVLVGRYLERRASPPAGFRPGVFVVCAQVFVIAWLCHLAATAFQELGVLGVVFALALAAALIVGAALLFLNAGFSGFLVSLEEQGWFHGTSYKPNQGWRVRFCTSLALLIVGGFGVFRMFFVQHAFGSDILFLGNNWELSIPGTELVVPLMYQVHISLLPIFCFAVIWLAWRIVNLPAFADFLIATDAELNKVSWTTRKRLVQDTIVVLVTVVLLTFFLFAVDIFWVWGLRMVGVLHVDPQAQQRKQQETAQW